MSVAENRGEAAVSRQPVADINLERATNPNHPTGWWLPWLLFGLDGALVALDLLFLALTWTTPVPDTWGFRGAAAILALAFACIGQLLARQRPENLIGWLFLACSLVMGIDGLGADYAAYALLTRGGILPGGVFAGWAASWLWPAYIGIIVYALLLFPTGRLPSSRWRPIIWVLAGSIGVWLVTLALRSGPLWFAPYVRNPVVMPGSEGALRLISVINGIAIGLCILAAVASMLQRLRHAQGIERQQLKWFVYVSMLLSAIGLINSAAGMIVGPPNNSGPKAFQVLTVVVFLAIPLVVGLAIQRYHLYDIDLLINHTLVYGTLSAGVVLAYIFIVGFLGAMLNTNMNLAAAIITVALAVLLFRPLRAGMQRAVNGVTSSVAVLPRPDYETEESRAGSEISLKRDWLALARGLWIVLALNSILVFSLALGVTFHFLSNPSERILRGLAQQGLSLGIYAGVIVGVLIIIFIVWFIVALLIFLVRPHDGFALFTAIFLVSTGATFAAPRLAEFSQFVSNSPLWFSIPQFISGFFTYPLIVAFLVLYPDGHFVPRWSWIPAVYSFLIAAGWSLLLGEQHQAPRTPLGIFAEISIILVSAGAFYAQYWRYRHYASPLQRQQTKWFVFAAAVFFVGAFIGFLPLVLFGHPLIPADSVWGDLAPASSLSALLLPIAIGIGILRYRLWDIDVILHRALVYGALSIGIVALYILLVGTLSALSQTSGNLLVSLLATGLIAVLFQPLRERLQRGVNRLLYGERDEPYALIARLGQNLETTAASDTLLTTLVRTIAQALKFPYVAIETGQDEDADIAAAYGQAPTQAQRIPLAYQGERLGHLLVAPRSPEEPLSPADVNLLRIIAQQAGMAVHAVQLTEDLQRSRERMVVTREEERRRIRRDLHDGLGPALASLAMQADNAREWVRDHPEKIDATLADITGKAQAALDDIRRLVYDLRPPALDELGLVGALRQTAANSPNGLNIEIDVSEPLPPLSAAVEVAAYRIAQEALSNVMQHSQARNCTIRLSVQDGLELEIRDDGVGLPPDARAGVGLISIRERTAELGGSCAIESTHRGGTRVSARLPLARLEDQHG